MFQDVWNKPGWNFTCRYPCVSRRLVIYTRVAVALVRICAVTGFPATTGADESGCLNKGNRTIKTLS